MCCDTVSYVAEVDIIVEHALKPDILSRKAHWLLPLKQLIHVGFASKKDTTEELALKERAFKSQTTIWH